MITLWHEQKLEFDFLITAKLNAHDEAKRTRRSKRMNALLTHMVKLCTGEFSSKVLKAKLAYLAELVKLEG